LAHDHQEPTPESQPPAVEKSASNLKLKQSNSKLAQDQQEPTENYTSEIMDALNTEHGIYI
jgi:hypothetical protein